MELQRFAEELRRAGRRIPDGPRAMAELKALLQEKARGS
jgi:hypothetical protein